MIIRDAIGNTIKKGDTLYWKGKDLFVKVADVFQPEPKAPGGLMVVMALPLEGKVGENIQLLEFVRTVDPQSEAVVADMAAKVREADEIAHEPYSAKGVQ